MTIRRCFRISRSSGSSSSILVAVGLASVAEGAAGAAPPQARPEAPLRVSGRVWVVGRDNIDTDMIYHNKYLAVTDHSQTLKLVGGLDERRLLAQLEEIDRLNAKLKGIRLMKGIEVEILTDGSLDLPDRVLQRLDLVIGSVHSGFRLPARQQTDRILRAMDHRFFSILGHPSGRLINERDAYAVDMAAVIRKAKERGCFLELNANPQRLDLTDTYCQMAKEAGVLVAINTDAHSVAEFGLLAYGVGQARRGWLEKKDVLNTRSLNELRTLLKQTMGG